MPLFVADYLADTWHLSPAEHGAYLLLIMNYWQRGKPLPSDDAKLARLLRMSAKEWSSVKCEVSQFFRDDGDTWHHARIEDELERCRTKAEQASRAGRASALQRESERSTVVERTLNASSNPVEQPDENKPDENKPDEKNKGRPASQGTRLTEEWLLSDDDRTYAEDQGIARDRVDRIAENFRDYWVSKAGKTATKTNWSKTWRIWCRREVDNYGAKSRVAVSDELEEWANA